jgi:outer membrane receptor protein involved in Fe transport
MEVMVSRRIVIGIFLLTLIFSSLFGGTTGKIVGTVTDKSNGEPLIGVNILIPELLMGTASDEDGFYFINNIPPGQYLIEFNFIGYQKVEYKNVSITVDHTTEINVEMQSEALELGEVITVVAEAPLIKIDETSQRSIVQGEQIIDKLPVSTLNDVLAIQPGVIKDESGSIHIRGGRQDEVAYLIDGTYVRNPFDNSLGGTVDAQAIQEMEIISGTFNAEYGNALSGVINIITKEGSPDFKFRMQYESPMLNSSPYHQADWLLQTDLVKGLSSEEKKEYLDVVRDPSGNSAYRRFRISDHKFTQDLKVINMLGRLSGSLSGPMPYFKEKFQFFLGGTFRNEESPLPYGFDLERVLSGRLTYKPKATIKLQFSGDWSRLYYQDYNHQYKYWQYFESVDPEIGSYPVSEDNKTRFTLKLTHTLSSATYYNLSLSRIYNYEEYIVPERTVVTDPNTGELISSDYITRDYYQGVDGSFQIGDPRYWRKTKTTTYDGDFDFVSQMNRYNQVKTGLEFRQHEIFRHQIGMPPRERLEYFDRKPIEFAGYVQDKIELSFLIVNVGLRYDYFDPKDEYYPDPSKILQTTTTSGGETVISTVPTEKVKAKKKLSPRIGFAHPITQRTVFHFAYGQFFQIPRYYDLYRNNELRDILVNDALIGNPGLLPEETTAFEAGIKQQIGEDYALNLTAFFKDIDNLISSFYYFSGRDYTIFINADFGRVQGFELSLNKKYSHYFGGAFNYTYMIAEGNESDPIEGYTLYREEDTHLRPNRNFPLDFDKRHSFNANLDVFFPENFGPTLFGSKILGQFSMNLLFRADSGLPYTPTSRDPDATVVPERNSARKGWFRQFDVRVNKRFKTFSNTSMDLYLRVENIFDNINTLRVWTATGDPWDQGITSTYSKDRQANPENVGIRRTIRLGLIFRI